MTFKDIKVGARFQWCGVTLTKCRLFNGRTKGINAIYSNIDGTRKTYYCIESTEYVYI